MEALRDYGVRGALADFSGMSKTRRGGRISFSAGSALACAAPHRASVANLLERIGDGKQRVCQTLQNWAISASRPQNTGAQERKLISL
jgi:hypothetical protein